MKRFRITLKNYRTFADTDPIRVEIGPGFTALVGPNNSGKSTLKLFFYELRSLFDILSRTAQSPGIATVFAQNGEIQAECKDVLDAQEIFNNKNPRPISIEVEILDAQGYENRQEFLKKVVMQCERSRPNVWRVSAYTNYNQFPGIVPPVPVGNISSGGNVISITPRPIRVGNTMRQSNALNIDCRDVIEVMQCLASARYYGPFRNAINQGAASHFDLSVGTAFTKLWNDWKVGGNRSKMTAIARITDQIRRLFGFEQLEINASDPHKTLMISVDNEPYRLGELGSGLAQFIIVLANAATSPPTLLMIDEPETNLHPALQIDFLLTLAHYASVGVLFSTHSIGLARSVAEDIYTVTKGRDGTQVRPFAATQNYLEFIGELSFSAFRDLGSDSLLLVEGVHDVKVMQQLLRLVHREHAVVILPLGGEQLACGGREQELEQFKRISSKISVIVDSERDSQDAEPKPSRTAFAETCTRLGFNVCLTNRCAIENYFTDTAVKSALGPSFSFLGGYEVLRNSRTPWSKADNWKIARYLTLEELQGTDLGAFLATL